jgi:hypothetical protein
VFTLLWLDNRIILFVVAVVCRPCYDSSEE